MLHTPGPSCTMLYNIPDHAETGISVLIRVSKNTAGGGGGGGGLFILSVD